MMNSFKKTLIGGSADDFLSLNYDTTRSDTVFPPVTVNLAMNTSTIESGRMSKIETFDNAYPGRRYVIRINCPEFTAVCPKTGLPDFGTIHIEYIPDKKCIELKALKYYLLDFRNTGIFYEMVTNQILDDLVEACSPLWMKVEGDFSPRGGITTTVTATYECPSLKQEDK